MKTARSVAYGVLLGVTKGQAFANLALQRAYRNGGLSVRDKGLCTEIVYGTLQRQRSLDEMLSQVCRRPLDELNPEVLTILRMTAYQLGYLDKVPAYAALNEAVEICKSVTPRAANFVNGVLRGFARVGKTANEWLRVLTAEEPVWAERMGIIHSFPTWLVAAWERAFGKDVTERLLEALNARTHLSVRVNVLRARVPDLLEETEGAGVDTAGDEPHATQSPVSPYGIRFSKGIDVEEWPPFVRGDCTVQDETAMLVAPLLQPKEHARILDMCAAPGTKTTHIAELQGDMGQIEACDIHPHKLRLIHQACERLGIRSIRTLMMDARLLPSRPDLVGAYDAVLLDAPCSGLGVLRHRPDIRWHRTQADVDSLRRLQVDLLRAAAKLVKPGGLIVYSTCTLLPDENERVVEEIVEDASCGVVWDTMQADLPTPVAEYEGRYGPGLLVMPQDFGTDGFYMARLRKQ